MGDSEYNSYHENGFYDESENSSEGSLPVAESTFDYVALLKEHDPAEAAEMILESTYGEIDIMKKDAVDRFLDFIYFKVQTGYWENPNVAYPTKKMNDHELEALIVDLLNNHLYPEIVLKLLKFFTRNIHDPDTNLYIANLIVSEDIMRSIYETFILFKKDIFIPDPDRRSLNVKRIQQFSPRTDNKVSSPLDAAARLKYVLEFIYEKLKPDHIFTKENLRMSAPAE